MSSADYDVAYCDACERCHLNGICPLTDKAQKVVSMTDAGWASEKVTAECIRDTLREQGNVLSPHVVAQCIDDLLTRLTALQRGRGGKG